MARRRLGMLAAAACLVVAASCGGADDAGEHDDTTSRGADAADVSIGPLPQAVQELDIDATEYAFEITPDPATTPLRAGWTKLNFHNVGGEAHQIMFAQLKPDADMAELAAAGAGDSSGAGAIEFVDMLGGVSYIAPQRDVTAMVNLPEGVVIAMCYVPDADGVAHALEGMSTMLTVGPAPKASEVPDGAEAEPVRGTIAFDPAGYDIPSPLPTGWYHVVNREPADPVKGLHELSLMRLERAIDDDEAATLVDELATNATPGVAVDAVGGLGAISPGFDGYLWLDLPEGDYLAVDFMPDARRPVPHMVDGYWALFSP